MLDKRIAKQNVLCRCCGGQIKSGDTMITTFIPVSQNAGGYFHLDCVRKMFDLANDTTTMKKETNK
jgi:hypothetical protein